MATMCRYAVWVIWDQNNIMLYKFMSDMIQQPLTGVYNTVNRKGK